MKKRTDTRWNSRLKNPTKALPKSGPVRKRNPVRAAKQEKEQYGKHAVWVRKRRCFVCEKMGKVQASSTVAAHAGKTRGAGGKARDIVDLCGGHEQVWHYHGCETFNRIFGVNCKARAAYLWSVSPHNPENTREEAK